MDNTNNIDTNLYNEKSLYLLNIRELRDIGRKFGVPSPTTMKKQDLIDYILKIVYGEIAPSRSNYGRPNVREFDMNKYLNKIKKNSDLTDELLKIKLDDDFFGVGDLKLAAPAKFDADASIENRVFVEDEEKFYLRVHAFVKSERDIEISKEYAEKLKLENFDVLEVRVVDDMFKIITVNGVAVSNKFNDFAIEKETLSSGTKHYFYVRTKEEKEEKINKIESYCKEKNAKMLLFANKKHTDWCTLVTYDKNEGFSKMYKNFMSIMSECEKLEFEGEDFVLVIESAEDIDSMIESFDDDVLARTKNNINSMVEKLLNLGNVFVSFRTEVSKNY